MADAPGKSEQAFRTIGELASELDVPQHILRYWESRFPQLKPLQRAGNRRYYRPADVALARRIHRLLNQDGYTIRGVQQLLASGGGEAETAAPAAAPEPASERGDFPLDQLKAIRRTLAEALNA
ncbi:MAG TPA: MerR family transcriptional regulator [Allosphingosinicella sp.]|jgi:DNA-binding transcriptional MerR regulator